MNMDSENKKTKQLEGTETFYSPRYYAPSYPSNPYEPVNPYATPKYKQRKRLIVILISLICLVVVVTGVLLAMLVVTLHSQNSTIASNSPFIHTATSMPENPLDTPDFVSFLTAFNNNIAAHNWNVISSHADATNFSNQYSYSTYSQGNIISGDEDWSKTYSDLQNGGLTTKVDIPPDFLNWTAGLSCAQYDPNGVAGHQVNAHQVYYIYAWGTNSHLSINGVVINPLRQIVEFEQVNSNGSWQWLGIFSHLSVDSNNSISLDCDI